jgi:hypothetical protein
LSTPRDGRGRRKKRLPLLVLAGAGFVLLGVSAALMAYEALFRPGPELLVSTSDGAEVLRVPLRTDPTWEVRWTHSVAGIVVRDIFAWRDERMLLTDTLTPQLDVAGLGHIPGRGDLRDDGDGGYWIAEIDEPIEGGSYVLRVGGERAPTVLVHGAREFDLTSTHAGQRLRLEVRVP